jgi:putative chitinase
MYLKAFYDVVRETFLLSKENVEGFDFILEEGEKKKIPLHEMAYMLATAWLETAHTMQPIKEYGGTAYFHKMYDIQGSRPNVAKNLGNTVPGDGAKFAGRGYVMITGRSNYQKASNKFGVNFIAKPDLVMQEKYALPIFFVGMQEGWFTGKKLKDFIDNIDEPDAEDRREFEGARRIINGPDKARTIAGYALVFEKALKAGGYGKVITIKPTKPVKEPTHVVVDDPGVDPSESTGGSLWASLAALLARIFGGRNA